MSEDGDLDLTWPDDLDAFAEGWMAEIRSGGEPGRDDFGRKVVVMNFFGSPETQWAFLLAAVRAAQSEEELAAIAAGPFEHLLGHHGDAYIEAVEAESRRDPRFAQMVTESRQYQMSDEIWARVEVIRSAARRAPTLH